MNTAEAFLVAMTVVFALPYLVWRLADIDAWAPLVVVQILAGIALGPGVLGQWWPDLHAVVFTPPVIQALNGVAWWAVMLFVFIAGIELDLGAAWRHRRETGTTAALALGVPLLAGGVAACGGLMTSGWIGPAALPWQFVVGVGMACAVTALPILVLFLERLSLLREPMGQRILRYASLDDILIWAVMALILMDWQRMGHQAAFLLGFGLLAWAMRVLMRCVAEQDRWYLAPVWLAVCALAADWAGLHYMVGAFLAGAVLDADLFDRAAMDTLRHHVLMLLMPVFFLSTGLRTHWSVQGADVLIAALVLLVASVGGKLLGVRLAGHVLGWSSAEARLVGWLLQTKALIMIIFANILLDRQVITADAFTALLLMAVGSTMLTVPMAAPLLARLRGRLGSALWT
ncbi:sodium/hydrogen exchanger [Leptothrix cholodnii SP-6]|uniref:Sodium/hydrogen exchanger n=1 Tax=Leptothrix cholodnii (strain ATCC 51168 / LMG 8142 / SP-6) TaxID=395495 RepID=B1Y1M6_LEPCP|nr:cation:proton antiporter [Leptothrix cholodnii]ACB35488.1 sodium/hydrogen exchanger [Leptothrix cholodnii SP-6]